MIFLENILILGLTCGVRTDNSAVGVYHLDKNATYSYPKNITELCIERGMLTGVITTDETTGATPASFSAHSSDRDDEQELTDDKLIADGEKLNNYEIPIRIAYTLGFKENEFPVSVIV